MNEKIPFDYAVIALAEILFEEHLINDPTMKAIKIRVQDEQSHISQNDEQSL